MCYVDSIRSTPNTLQKVDKTVVIIDNNDEIKKINLRLNQTDDL